MTSEIADHVVVSRLVDRLEGRDGGLRSSKPDTDADTGLTQYVWRMARFHGGYDTRMPVTASWWLQEYLDETDVDASVSGIMDDAGKDVTEYLEDVTETVLVRLGENPNRGATRWAQTGAL